MKHRVIRIAHHALALVAIRLVLSLGGFGASLVAGAERQAAAVGLAFGTGACAVALLSDRRWLLFQRQSLEPLPPGSEPGDLPRAIAKALMPSTIGVAVLLAVSLAFEPVLAAVLAGVLGGMALVGLTGLVDLLFRERQAGVRYYADAAEPSRRYLGAALNAGTDMCDAVEDSGVDSGVIAAARELLGHAAFAVCLYLPVIVLGGEAALILGVPTKVGALASYGAFLIWVGARAGRREVWVEGPRS